MAARDKIVKAAKYQQTELNGSEALHLLNYKQCLNQDLRKLYILHVYNNWY